MLNVTLNKNTIRWKKLVLLFKVLFNHTWKRQFVVLHCHLCLTIELVGNFAPEHIMDHQIIPNDIQAHICWKGLHFQYQITHLIEKISDIYHHIFLEYTRLNCVTLTHIKDLQESNSETSFALSKLLQINLNQEETIFLKLHWEVAIVILKKHNI